MEIKQKIIIGSILEINIENEYYTYAQILDKSSCVFFDFKSPTRIDNFDFLASCPVLFILGIYNNVIKHGHWKIVGKFEIREDLKVRPLEFIQDALNPDKFEFYNPNTGEIFPAKKNEIKGLERASVWDSNHVEDRIRDYYNNVPCVWLEDDIKLFEK